MYLFCCVVLQIALLRLRSIKSVVIVKRIVHNECKCKCISRKNKCLYDFFVILKLFNPNLLFMNKNIISLFGIFIISFFGSCFHDCKCFGGGLFERTYTDVIVRAWDTSGFVQNEVINTAPLQAFGLTVSIDISDLEITLGKPKQFGRMLGFGALYACSCPPPEYTFPNTVETIQIEVEDVETQEIIDASNQFTSDVNQNKMVDLVELIDPAYPYLELNLTNQSAIPEIAVFHIIITLSSGDLLVAQTQEIEFI